MAKISGVPSPAGTPAESRGAVDSDNIGPLDESTRKGLPVEGLSDGPKIGENREYQRARYELPPVEVVDRYGRAKIVSGRIREDR